ncbi:MAG TPA: lipoprotein [Cellvibrio sp.]
MKIAVVFVLLCLSLGACGQKGPLYLPQPNKPQPPAPQTQPAPPAEPAQPEADQSSASPTAKPE